MIDFKHLTRKSKMSNFFRCFIWTANTIHVSPGRVIKHPMKPDRKSITVPPVLLLGCGNHFLIYRKQKPQTAKQITNKHLILVAVVKGQTLLLKHTCHISSGETHPHCLCSKTKVKLSSCIVVSKFLLTYLQNSTLFLLPKNQN